MLNDNVLNNIHDIIYPDGQHVVNIYIYLHNIVSLIKILS